MTLGNQLKKGLAGRVGHGFCEEGLSVEFRGGFSHYVLVFPIEYDVEAIKPKSLKGAKHFNGCHDFTVPEWVV